MNPKKIVILYERLSRDDNIDSESNSIKNQKLLLEDYAVKNGMTNFVHMTDDGVSGLRFDDRPGYVQMMDEVEDGNVSAICVKDITRLGRDYLRVGMCMEQLRINGVRLIALGDGIDTAKGEDDFTPFRTVMAEFYAKDTSRNSARGCIKVTRSPTRITGAALLFVLYYRTHARRKRHRRGRTASNFGTAGKIPPKLFEAQGKRETTGV